MTGKANQPFLWSNLQQVWHCGPRWFGTLWCIYCAAYRSTGAQETQKDSATLLHSLILIFADAGAGGLSIQEAVRRIKKKSLPGLREKGKVVQVAKITRNHPDFVACDNVGCFALRKTLLRSFQCGSLDPEEYADEKKMEAIVFEKYAASAAALPELQASPRSSVQTPNIKRRD